MISFQNTFVIPAIFLKPHALLCESVNLPSLQNQWIRKPKLHIFETALQNGFFLDPTGLLNSCGRLKQAGEGRESKLDYTTPNSSGRKYQVFNFSISGFVFKWPKNVYMNRNRWRCSIVTITEATQRQWRRQRERQKSNKLRLVFLYIFLCRHCSTKTWKSLISPFMEDVNTKQRYSFCFCSAVAWGGAGGRAWPSPNNFDRHV